MVNHLIVYPMSKLASDLHNLWSPASSQDHHIHIFHSPKRIINYVGELHVLFSQVHKFMITKLLDQECYDLC